jgi:phosphoribosylformimino-5-aminoimidazole carboxamide ribotide isomerase
MPLELIPVLDLRAGRAVHARGGVRAFYASVASVLAPDAGGNAVRLARAYRERVGARRCYVADLDAIDEGTPQRLLLNQVATAFGGTLLVDAGLRTVADLERIEGRNPVVPVAGTETLAGWDALEALLARRPDLVLSLDLRDGHVLGPLGVRHADAFAVARSAAALGVRELLVLDLARVGRGQGPAVELLRTMRHAVPRVRLVAGGGVRDDDDVVRLAEAGADAALVASALHAGALAAAHAQSPTSGIR